MFQTLPESRWYLTKSPWLMTRSSCGEKYHGAAPSVVPGNSVTSALKVTLTRNCAMTGSFALVVNTGVRGGSAL